MGISRQTGNDAKGTKPEIAAFVPTRDVVLGGPKTDTRADVDALADRAAQVSALRERATSEWASDVRASGKFDQELSI